MPAPTRDATRVPALAGAGLLLLAGLAWLVVNLADTTLDDLRRTALVGLLALIVVRSIRR